MDVNPFIFRAYDVRGKVGIDITPEVFEPVGRAYGTLVRRNGGRRVALGMDNRVTSPPLKEAFGQGVLSTGLDVVGIGVNTTPLLYFATAHWKLDGGATVTGSHNPVSDNGVKMIHAGAAPLTEDEIQGLLDTIRAGDFERGEGTRTARDPREGARSGPTSASPSAGTPTGWAWWTSAGGGTRPTSSWRSWPAISSSAIRAPRSCSTSSARRCWWRTSAPTAGSPSCGRPATR